MIIAVASPSASGKTTLVTQAVSKFNLHRLVTTTTRKPRLTESQSDYHFVSVDEFNQLKAADDFIENNEVYGNYYGLTKSEVYSHAHKHCIVILDVGGVESLRKLFPDDVKSIFIMPKSVDELKKRLIERDSEPEEISRRLDEVDREVSEATKFHFIHINGDYAESVEEFNKLIAHLIN
jgi:guanylate kinase